MVNYNEGKIYKIESTLGNMVYYGSTTKKRLCDRMTKHRGDYKRWLNGKRGSTTVFKLFDAYAIENCRIVLVENCPCESKDELTSKEAYYIRNFECINKNIPDRTIKEWRKDNKDKIVERTKKWYEDNKDKILERAKKYREDNKDKLSEQRKIKYTCICGSNLCKSDKTRHEQSKKHIKFLESQ